MVFFRHPSAHQKNEKNPMVLFIFFALVQDENRRFGRSPAERKRSSDRPAAPNASVCKSFLTDRYFYLLFEALKSPNDMI